MRNGGDPRWLRALGTVLALPVCAIGVPGLAVAVYLRGGQPRWWLVLAAVLSFGLYLWALLRMRAYPRTMAADRPWLYAGWSGLVLGVVAAVSLASWFFVGTWPTAADVGPAAIAGALAGLAAFGGSLVPAAVGDRLRRRG